MIEQQSGCWQCLLWPLAGDTPATFSRRLTRNHAWTGGEHTFRGGGRLILPRSSYEPIEDEPSMIPVITSQQCRHGRRLCMTCTSESRTA